MAATSSKSGGGRDLALTAYRDLARALARVDLLQAASSLCFEDPDGGIEVSADDLERFLKARELPGQFFDLMKLGTALHRARRAAVIEPPAVSRVTPFLRLPIEKLSVTYPIHVYVLGDLDDVLKLQPRQCTYAVFDEPYERGKIRMFPISNPSFIDALSRAQPLAEMIESADDVNQWLRWLCSLADSGIVLWLRPLAEEHSAVEVRY